MNPLKIFHFHFDSLTLWISEWYVSYCLSIVLKWISEYFFSLSFSFHSQFWFFLSSNQSGVLHSWWIIIASALKSLFESAELTLLAAINRLTAELAVTSLPSLCLQRKFQTWDEIHTHFKCVHDYDGMHSEHSCFNVTLFILTRLDWFSVDSILNGNWNFKDGIYFAWNISTHIRLRIYSIEWMNEKAMYYLLSRMYMMTKLKILSLSMDQQQYIVSSRCFFLIFFLHNIDFTSSSSEQVKSKK